MSNNITDFMLGKIHNLNIYDFAVFTFFYDASGCRPDCDCHKRMTKMSDVWQGV